jgi:hypothetical protein
MKGRTPQRTIQLSRQRIRCVHLRRLCWTRESNEELSAAGPQSLSLDTSRNSSQRGCEKRSGPHVTFVLSGKGELYDALAKLGKRNASGSCRLWNQAQLRHSR